jgi:hypothetical protein
MYNRDEINRLVAYIENLNGINDKEKLSAMLHPSGAARSIASPERGGGLPQGKPERYH